MFSSTYKTLPNRYMPPQVRASTRVFLSNLLLHTPHRSLRKNFGMIEEDLYRSGQPNELNFPFLEKLGLKTVVFLAPEEPNQKLCVYLRC